MYSRMNWQYFLSTAAQEVLGLEPLCTKHIGEACTLTGEERNVPSGITCGF